MIPTGHLERMSPAEIIAFVATNTLAVISTWSTEELIRIGWIGNPIVDILYSLTSAGVWIARTDASGLVTEANSASMVVDTENIQAYTGAMRQMLLPSVSGTIITEAIAAQMRRRIAQIAIDTNAGGESAVVDLYDGSGLGAYYPVLRLKRIISDVADAVTTLTITVTGGALVGPASFVLNLVADTVNEQIKDVLLYNLTDASSIHAQITGGPVSGTIFIEVERWAET